MASGPAIVGMGKGSLELSHNTPLSLLLRDCDHHHLPHWLLGQESGRFRSRNYVQPQYGNPEDR